MQSEQFQLNAELELKHWWFVGRRQIINGIIAEVLPPRKDTVVVDIGCGTGGNLASLADRYSCVGIDPSKDAIQWARQRFPSAKFICGMAPRDCQFDLANASLVMLNDVMEHVPDDFLLLSELFSATPPGCLFLITVPAEPRLWSPHDESHGHYRRYTVERLRRVWRDLPVRENLVSPFNSRLYPVVRSVRWLSQFRGQSFGRSGTDLKLPAGWINAVLTNFFHGEGQRLDRVMRQRAKPYSYGVSLLALLTREEGTVQPAARPHDVAADLYDPTSATHVAGRPE